MRQTPRKGERSRFSFKYFFVCGVFFSFTKTCIASAVHRLCNREANRNSTEQFLCVCEVFLKCFFKQKIPSRVHRVQCASCVNLDIRQKPPKGTKRRCSRCIQCSYLASPEQWVPRWNFELANKQWQAATELVWPTIQAIVHFCKVIARVKVFTA